MDTFKWHKQSEDGIWMAIDDCGYHTFACLMKDSKLVKFEGLLDKNCECTITPHIDSIIMDGDYDYNIDDIEMWIEIPKK